MKLFKKLLLLLFLLSLKLSVFANDKKKVFAFNSILFVNSPGMGVLPKINAKQYLYDSEKSWLDNNELFYPVVSDLAKQMSLHDAVDFEIKSAMEMGIDGFSFTYVISKNKNLYKRYNEIIEAYFEVAEKNNYPFYFNINLKFEPNSTIDDAIADASIVLKDLTNNKFANSDHWYVEKNKKVVILSKIKSLLSKEEMKTMEKSNDKELDFSTFFNRIHKINNATLNDYNFIYTCIWPGRKKEMIEASKEFYAVRMEYLNMIKSQQVDRFNSLLKLNNMPFIHTIYHEHLSSFYVEKSTKKKKPRNFVIKEGLVREQCYKEYDDLGLSKGLRLGFEQASKNNASLIILNSWNLFIEGTHFRQDYNHGFGLSPFVKTLISIWKKETTEPGIFIAYKNRQKNSSNFVEYKVRRKIGDTKYSKDSIEVITYSETPAKLIINGNISENVGAGLTVKTIPWKEGNLNITLKANKTEIASLNTSRIIRETENRSQPTTIYQSSMDEKFTENFVNTLALKEVNYFDIRFMLDKDKKTQWLEIEEERMKSHIQNLTANETNYTDFISEENKNNEKYEKKMSKLLPEFQYGLWKEMKAEKQREVNSTFNNYDLYDLNNSYNVLEID